MTKKKHYFGGMLAMLTTLLMVGCFVNDNPVRTSLEVDTSNLVLSIGESATRSASSKASEAEITYSSSKPAVATVDQKGKVTGVSEGEATITISMPEARKSWYAAKTISYKVIVKNVSATALKNVDKTTPLTLVATEDGKITVYFMNGITLANDIKYTINGGAEKTIAKNTEGSYDIVVKKGDVVQLYSNNTSLGGGGGVGARGMTRAIDSGAKFINIKPSMKTEIYGNVMSLLKGKDNLASANSIEGNNAFYGLFAGADKLVNSPERNLVLPATSLKQGCYQDMFSGCKGIEKAPELPAPTLVKDCYSGMFSGCSKLSEVKCLATDVSADGCVKDWLADAGKEAETPPVIEVTPEAQSAISKSIPKEFTPVIAISKITVEPTTLTLKAGETATLKATVEPEDATNKEVKWASDNEAVATVSAQGVVTAVAAGSTTITVFTDGSISATCTVTVPEEPKPEEPVVEPEPDNVLVTYLSLPEAIDFSSGSSMNGDQLLNVYPDNATDKSVTWSSDNPNVVSVDQNGKIQSPMNVTGVAHITVTANDGSNVSATCTFTVRIQGHLHFQEREVSLSPGTQGYINSSLNHTGNGTLAYSSSDESIATVDASTGAVSVSANATGGQTVTITAKVKEEKTDTYVYYDYENGNRASYTVKIVPPTSQGGRTDYTPGSW